jgi:hypothetical protein
VSIVDVFLRHARNLPQHNDRRALIQGTRDSFSHLAATRGAGNRDIAQQAMRVIDSIWLAEAERAVPNSDRDSLDTLFKTVAATLRRSSLPTTGVDLWAEGNLPWALTNQEDDIAMSWDSHNQEIGTFMTSGFFQALDD